MTATRNVHSPYPVGHGSATVPVLFSLPNVQPAIAAASTGIRQDPAGQEPAIPGIAGPLEPALAVSNRAETTFKKLTSQLTNITIGLLLVAVAGLAYRNQQQAEGGKSSRESAAVSQADLILPSEPAAPILVADNEPITHDPIKAPELKPETAPTPATSKEEAEQVVLGETSAKALVLQKEAAPLLLPMAPQDTLQVQGSREQAAGDRVTPTTSGPYGTTPTPFSLTSTKSPSERTQRDTIDTETPSLNTRDIILLRNGQRRAEGGATDPGLPKVESVSRSSGMRPSSSQNGGTPIMTGQSYPRIAPQYDPISMPTVTSGNPRITQPSPDSSQKPVQKQYVPLSPYLPNPIQANDFDNGNP
jgi:hypothetical protein